jgi:hypothetical protein
MGQPARGGPITPAMSAQLKAEITSVGHQNPVRPKLFRDTKRYLPLVS